MAHAGDPASVIEMNCQNLEKEPMGYDTALLGFISSKPRAPLLVIGRIPNSGVTNRLSALATHCSLDR
jgi:hypothetical protein